MAVELENRTKPNRTKPNRPENHRRDESRNRATHGAKNDGDNETNLFEALVLDGGRGAGGEIQVAGLLHDLLERDAVLDEERDLLVEVAHFLLELKVLLARNGDRSLQLDELLLT